VRMTDVAIRRPVFITMVFSGMVILGLLSIERLGVDLFPDTSFPIVSVQTLYPGASPAEVEHRVTDVVEKAVTSVNGVKTVRSFSRGSLSSVWIEFELSADELESTNEVRNRISSIRSELPQDIEEPVIARFDPGAIPILTFAVSGPESPIATRRWVEDVIQPRLERVPGVATVDVQGGAEREIAVLVARDRLESHGLSLLQVAQTLGAETVDVPSGRLVLGEREEALKASGRFTRVAEIRELELVRRADGGVVRLGDVAEVVDGVAEQRTITQVDGQPGVTFHVQKQGGSNTIAVTDLVEVALASLELPEGWEVTKLIDASEFIRINMAHLWEHLIVGGLMAVLVIFLFMLDWRSTVISSIALPTSIISTFFVMWQLGFSLNMMSMLGLTLAIGVLIDDSVVVRENIFRHMERGADPVKAAREGTREIAMAVLATTLTIVAVFVPVAFTGGLVGLFFREFGITVAVAVVISMTVSLTLDPMLSTKLTKPIPPDYRERQRARPIIGWIVRFYDEMDKAYAMVLRWTLRHRVVTVVSSAVILVGSCSLMPLMGEEFAGRGDRGDFTVAVNLPPGTSLEAAREAVTAIEERVAALPEHVTTATTLGPQGQVDRASLRVKLTHQSERERGIEDIMEALRGELAQIPGVESYLRAAGFGDGSMDEAPLTLEVTGPDYAVLGRLADTLMADLRATPGVRDASMTHRPGAKESHLRVDRARVSDLGVSFAHVAQTVRLAVEGQVATRLEEGADDVDVRLRLRPEDRADLATLRALAVPTARGQLVSIEQVTHVDDASAPAVIERVDRARVISISANVFERSLGEVVTDVVKHLDRLDVPPGYQVRFAGEAERMQETFANLALALALAILFIYLVLASQFESIVHPFTIMMALPLAVIGAIVALFLTGQAMGMAAMIGIILLMGIVTKNSILLVDYANQLRRDHGKTIMEAILIACPTRLRPILMTSAAIILGMLPAALNTAEGSEFQAPMAIAVIGGVITSTFLTLLVVPVVYIWLDRLTLVGFKEWRAARRAARSPDTAPTDLDVDLDVDLVRESGS